MDDEKRRAILDELIRYTTAPPLPDDVFTAQEYVDRCAELGEKISKKTANRRLKEGVLRGGVEGEKVGGAWQWRFVRPENPEE